MTRMEQAREAAAAVNREFATEGHIQCAAIIMTGAFDEEEDVRVALLAFVMERDRIVAFGAEYAAERNKYHGNTGDAIRSFLAALARDHHHKETNDIREGGFPHNESTKND